MLFDPPAARFMKSCLFVLMAGFSAGVFMGTTEAARAQEIGNDTGSQPPTIATPPAGSGTSGTQTFTPYGALALPPPPSQAPIAPNPATSPLLSTVPYGGAVSETGEALAEEMRRENANQKYNLRVGPVALRVEADMTATFNDNIGLTKNGREADILLTPMAYVHGRYEVSDLNTLTFDIGVGYQAYLAHSQYNCLLLLPDSAASFNFFVGDVAINLHDDFSYDQDPTQVAQLSNQVRLTRFINDIGFAARWDLNDVMLEADYDHNNFWVMNSEYKYLTNQSDTLAPKVTVKLDESIDTGVSASASYTRYEEHFENNNTSEQVGPFVDATLSTYLSLKAEAGLFLTQYDRGGLNGDNSDVFSYYGDVAVSHRINSAISESFTVGRGFLPGLYSNYTARAYATYGDSWFPTKEISVWTNLFWENLDDSEATYREDSNRYGLNLNLADSLSDQLVVNCSYQFLLKNANPSYLSYYQNQATVGMQYKF